MNYVTFIDDIRDRLATYEKYTGDTDQILLLGFAASESSSESDYDEDGLFASSVQDDALVAHATAFLLSHVIEAYPEIATKLGIHQLDPAKIAACMIDEAEEEGESQNA